MTELINKLESNNENKLKTWQVLINKCTLSAYTVLLNNWKVNTLYWKTNLTNFYSFNRKFNLSGLHCSSFSFFVNFLMQTYCRPTQQKYFNYKKAYTTPQNKWKNTVLQKQYERNENPVIYWPSCRSKPIWLFHPWNKSMRVGGGCL